MPRSWSARLAVLLFTIPIVIALRSEAGAGDECVPTPTGYECSFDGTTTSTSVTTLPPLRYLVVTTHPEIGPCWFWSRYPPGLDSENPVNEHEILFTRRLLPECPADQPGSTTLQVTSRAWHVFRSWRLAAPAPRIRPTVGITNLPSVLTAASPAPLRHTERLPDGRLLEVRASVASVVVDWGDGTPPFAYPAATFFGPGATHPYRLKTCSAEYRRHHPSGRNCHPALEEYSIRVTFRWVGRYRIGGPWTILGTVARTAAFTYDVDEVVGIPVRR